MGALQVAAAARLLLIGALLVSGCTRHVYSPPARLLPAESVAIVASDRIAAALEGGMHGAVFGPSIASASLRARRAITTDSEAVFEAHAMYVTNASDSRDHPVIYALRTGAKLRLAETFALTGGIGGGYSAGGGFLSPDLGCVLAYEGAYLVPFLAGRAHLSVPFAIREVDLGTNDGGGRIFQTASLTLGLQASLGARILFSRQRDTSPALLVAVGATEMLDRERDMPFFSLSAGLEAVF